MRVGLPTGMCGIFQVFSRNRHLDTGRFEAALARMKHRGPDHTGVHYHPVLSAGSDGSQVWTASGHQRLSILDLDPRSSQPFRKGGRTLVFNGEIYNYRQLRDEIQDGSLHFNTTGDTEVLFEGLGLKGLPFLNQANGMWAFTYLDESRALALVSRDRHGKKPLFYYADGAHVIFSSTVDSIHHYLGTKPRLDPAFVDSYLMHGAAFPGSDENTHFAGIKQIPAGHSAEFDLRSWKISLKPYFSVREASRLPLPADHSLSDLFRDAVSTRLVSDRKVGLLLSGGIDSTIILSALHAMGLQDQVHCFIGETGRSEDAAYARKCVEKLGIQATIVELAYGQKTLERILGMCRHHEKPFPFLGSSIAMAEMFEHIAEQDVRVVLDGTGGDELFGGYWERYLTAAAAEAYENGDKEWLKGVWTHAKAERTYLARGILRSVTGGVLGRQRFRAFRKRFSPASLTLGLHRGKIPSTDPLASFFGNYLDTVVTDSAPGGQLGEWIWHNDRNSMMHGIEGRSPLLDYRLVPYMGTGYAAKFHHQWNKHELRMLYDSLTPLPTQWRQQKQGFRWNGKVFLRENSSTILDLIAGSSFLKSRYPIATYVDRARKYPKMLVSGTTPRLLCVAGLDAALGLAST